MDHSPLTAFFNYACQNFAISHIFLYDMKFDCGILDFIFHNLLVIIQSVKLDIIDQVLSIRNFFFFKKKDTLIKNPKKKDRGLRLCNIFLANVKWLVLLNRMVAKVSLIHESKFYVHIESMIQIRKIKNFYSGHS